MSRLAAITGGTGFVGRACAVALLAAGWRVRLLARRDPSHPLLANLPVDVVRGDLDDEAALRRLVRGASAVVHAAGAIRARSAAAFLATNRDGTARLAAAMRDAPDCRFVLISSQAARRPELSGYAASKRAGELAVMATLEGATILRPGVIYGPWDQATAALLRVAGGGIVPVPSGPELRLAIMHIDDVARAAVAFSDARLDGIFELSDGVAEGHAWRDIVRLARLWQEDAARFVRLPDAAILAAGAASDAWANVTRQPAIFGIGKAREILHRDWRPDPRLQPPRSVWTPHIALADGLRETAAWWHARR